MISKRLKKSKRLANLFLTYFLKGISYLNNILPVFIDLKKRKTFLVLNSADHEIIKCTRRNSLYNVTTAFFVQCDFACTASRDAASILRRS